MPGFDQFFPDQAFVKTLCFYVHEGHINRYLVQDLQHGIDPGFRFKKLVDNNDFLIMDKRIAGLKRAFFKSDRIFLFLEKQNKRL